MEITFLEDLENSQQRGASVRYIERTEANEYRVIHMCEKGFRSRS